MRTHDCEERGDEEGDLDAASPVGGSSIPLWHAPIPLAHLTWQAAKTCV